MVLVRRCNDKTAQASLTRHLAVPRSQLRRGYAQSVNAGALSESIYTHVRQIDCVGGYSGVADPAPWNTRGQRQSTCKVCYTDDSRVDTPPSSRKGVWFAIERPEPMRTDSGMGRGSIVTSPLSFTAALDKGKTPECHVGGRPSVPMGRWTNYECAITNPSPVRYSPVAFPPSLCPTVFLRNLRPDSPPELKFGHCGVSDISTVMQRLSDRSKITMHCSSHAQTSSPVTRTEVSARISHHDGRYSRMVQPKP